MNVDMNNKKTNIFITGATSFLGRNTCSYLVKKGYNVFAFTREFSENNYKIKNIEGLNIIPINIDYITEEELDSFQFPSNKFKIVLNSLDNIKQHNNIFIHYAWKGTLRSERGDKDIQVYNLEQSKKWIKIANILGVKKFIFAGSQAEYSYNYYGIYKNKFAEFAENYVKLNPMIFLHMRIFSVYGNNDRNTTILSALLSAIKDRQDFDMTSCRKKWNFLYIDDYIKIIEKLILKKDISNNNVINMDIASNDTRPLREFIKEASRTLKARIKLNFGVKDDNSDVFAIPDISKMIDYIGKFKFIDFSKSIKDMYKKM